MTIEKKIKYEDELIKQKFLADLRERYEKAKEGGFKGDIREFILKQKIRHIGLAKGGKPNGVTTWSLDDWMNGINKGDLDPSTSFMQYLDMILGKSGEDRGGIISVVPMLS